MSSDDTRPDKALHWPPRRNCHGSCISYSLWKVNAAPAAGASERIR